MSTPKPPKAEAAVTPVKSADVYDTADSARNDVLRSRQSFMGSQLAGEDPTKNKGGFLGA